MGPIQSKEEEEDNITKLPKGWIEIIDEKSQKPYYYNEAENKVTWTKPEFVVEESESITTSEEQEQQQQQESSSESIVNDSMHQPEEEEKVIDDNKQQEENNNVLPANWIELLDRTSGKYYYYHTIDKITTWTRPKSTIKDESNTIESNNDNTQQQPPPQQD